MFGSWTARPSRGDRDGWTCFAPPWASQFPWGSSEWWQDVEDVPTVPNTFYELEVATAYGMLTRDQFNEVHAAVWQRSRR
jgi:hypothetical protein